MKRTPLLAGLLFATLSAQSAGAAMIERSFTDIAAESDAVFSGQVVAEQSDWTASHETIVTQVSVRVDESWFGAVTPGEVVTVERAGGQVGAIGVFVEDQPAFDEKEHVVLFVHQRPDGSFVVVSDVQGKLAIEGDELVSVSGVRYPIAAFRQAVESHHTANGPEGPAPFPEGWQGSPTTDDNVYAYCGIKWFSLPYTWWLNQSGAPGCTLADTQTACQTGFNTWTCASGVSMAYGGTTTWNASNHSDGANVLAWEYGALGSGTIALCSYVYYVETGQIIEADIQFNATHFSWSCSGSPTAVDVINLASHEIGHTLCLGDLYGGNDTNKTMYGYSGAGDFIKRSLHTADALGAEFIYSHSRANFVSPTPGGWSGPLVPRATADAGQGYAPLPGVLYGNTYSYVNAAMTNNGGDCASPQGANGIWLDGQYAWSNTWWGVWGGGYTFGWTNLAQWIRGGRHTLAYTLDDSQETLESNEGDNAYSGQWVWSPLVTGAGAPNVREVPPDRGPWALPNADGLAFSRDANYAWVTSLAPIVPGDDYDLYLYDDYGGSTSGFNNLRGSSAYGSNTTDFVVGHYSGTPTTVYPAVVRYALSSAYYYSADQIDATGRNGVETGSWVGQYLGDYRLADVYEGYFTAGNVYHLGLLRAGGSADIAFNVYPATAGGIYGRSSAAGYSYELDPNTDLLDYTATETGWHPIVVYRGVGTDMSAVVYDFHLAMPTAAPLASAPLRLEFQGVAPNPLRDASTLTFQLPSAQHVRLDVYDVSGRHIRGLINGAAGPGLARSVWDGTSDTGQRVAAGIYLAQLRADGRSMVRMIQVIR